MRIACLQFAPQVGDVDNNLNRADAVLSKANPQNLDLLVLPELAFSGYNFKSLQQISPFLEPTAAGITSLWARTTALKYECVVTVGYPEKVDVVPKWPASPEYYSSAIIVNADGETIGNYRKTFLYYTDETWALEGPDGFFDDEIEGLGNVAMGICKWPTKSFKRMDLNPYKFQAPWNAWELAHHIIRKSANLVIISMAWLTREDARSYSRTPKEPDMDTLSYWLARMEPLIRAETEDEIICVFANRTGTEDQAVYAGTSAVLGIQSGEVKVYGILGRGEKELLVVDTNKRPQAKLVLEPLRRNEETGNGVDNNGKSIDEKYGRNSKDNKHNDNAMERGSLGRERGPLVDGRANPTISEKSDINTKSQPTDLTAPDPIEAPRTMNDFMAPLSPVNPIGPSSFFGSQRQLYEGELLRETLKSSIIEPACTSPIPRSSESSPNVYQPPSSPKLRDSSGTRVGGMPECKQATPIVYDLVKGEQSKNGSAGAQSLMPQQPHSAAAAPEQFSGSFARSPFGPRTKYIIERPRSACW